MKELIQDAVNLLLDRPELREIIYWCLKRDDEEKAALLMAFQILKDIEESEKVDA